MESFMVEIAIMIFICLIMIILAGILGVILFVEKRIGHSSWFRNILAVVAGVDLISLSIASTIGNVSSLESIYFLRDTILPFIYLLTFVLEILVSILGGYTAGKIARQNEIVYGFLVGLGMVLFSIGFRFESIFSLPQFNVLDLALRYTVQICSTTLGGYIALSQRERNQSEFTDHGEAKSAA